MSDFVGNKKYNMWIQIRAECLFFFFKRLWFSFLVKTDMSCTHREIAWSLASQFSPYCPIGAIPFWSFIKSKKIAKRKLMFWFQLSERCFIVYCSTANICKYAYIKHNFKNEAVMIILLLKRSLHKNNIFFINSKL